MPQGITQVVNGLISQKTLGFLLLWIYPPPLGGKGGGRPFGINAGPYQVVFKPPPAAVLCWGTRTLGWSSGQSAITESTQHAPQIADVGLPVLAVNNYVVRITASVFQSLEYFPREPNKDSARCLESERHSGKLHQVSTGCKSNQGLSLGVMVFPNIRGIDQAQMNL